MGKRFLVIWAVIASVLLPVACASAHDLWLVPAKFTVTPGARLEVTLRTGATFPVSENALKPERIERASLVTRRGSSPLSAYRTEGKSTVVDVTAPRTGGAMVVEVVVKPMTTKQARDSFDEFIRHEGLDHVAAQLARESTRREEERRVYTKYAKTLLRVGTGKREAALFSRPLGHRLEIVPEADPFSLGAGGELLVRLFFDGKPLPFARVVAGSSVPETATQAAVAGVRTDAAGRARLRLDASGGPHYVHALHMIPAQGRQDVEWETFWATLTFELTP